MQVKIKIFKEQLDIKMVHKMMKVKMMINMKEEAEVVECHLLNKMPEQETEIQDNNKDK